MQNPFRPGAGHMPPYMAGRKQESEQFSKLLEQDVVLKNLILTGLRGLGKTVLLETFKPMAMQTGWLWAGTDLSESTSISEESLATRLLTDLSVVLGSFVVQSIESPAIGFSQQPRSKDLALSYTTLRAIFDSTPGLVLDKLKGVLETVWPYVEAAGRKGIIFAYDEAQNLTDHAKKDQYPLSLLLDLFQSLQKKGLRYMLALVGLPTLFPKLVEARTFSERMFTVVTLRQLDRSETSEAALKPIADAKDCPIGFDVHSVERIWKVTHGYPYFVQYVCREIFDIWVQAVDGSAELPRIPMAEIVAKLDSDFFAGRWAKATDRQRALLGIIAELPNADVEFSVQEIVESPINKSAARAFSSSHVNQMLVSLAEAGLVYKNRYGRYSFAVPLLGSFILRQKAQYRPESQGIEQE
jgi:hypothetical protein